MSFVAEAARSYDDPPEHVFDRLADARGWRSWMPRTFQATSVPDRPLRTGDRLLVRVAFGPPTKLAVEAAERAREITWTGGVPGVLFAQHRFLFEARAGGGTTVRSVERWSGALAGLTRRLVQPLAERIGRAQLEGLARACAMRAPERREAASA